MLAPRLRAMVLAFESMHCRPRRHSSEMRARICGATPVFVCSGAWGGSGDGRRCACGSNWQGAPAAALAPRGSPIAPPVPALLGAFMLVRPLRHAPALVLTSAHRLLEPVLDFLAISQLSQTCARALKLRAIPLCNAHADYITRIDAFQQRSARSRSPLAALTCLQRGGAASLDSAPNPARAAAAATTSGGGVAFAASAMLLVSAHRTVFSAAMPELQASLGFDSKTVGALQAAYLAGYGLTNAAGGAAADRVGGARRSSLFVWLCGRV